MTTVVPAYENTLEKGVEDSTFFQHHINYQAPYIDSLFRKFSL